MKSPTEIHAVEIPRSPLEFHRRLVQHKAKHFFRDFFRPFYIQALKKPLFKGLTYFMVPVPRKQKNYNWFIQGVFSAFT